MLLTENSWIKYRSLIPNGAQTLSKAPERYVNGVYPKFLTSAFGAETYDETGESYIDYISCLGAVLVGHSHPAILDSVKEGLANGEILTSLPSPKEAELAIKLNEYMPFIEQVKYFKTGSETTSAAVRLARAYTGRTKVLACGYNGWHDWCAIGYDRLAGVPLELVGTLGRFNYNDIESFKKQFKEPIAAVIIEPAIFDEPKENFLQQLCSFAHANGALVIFDEIVTGFRFGFSGLSGFFGIAPDLICLGKAMANGFPMGVLGGPRKFMSTYEKPDFFVSGTFGGDLIGIHAALATMEVLRPQEVWTNGLALKTGFNAIVKDLGLEEIACVGYAPRTKFQFPTVAHKSLFWQECVKKGVLFGHCNFPTMAHGRVIIERTMDVIYDSLKFLKANFNDPLSKLEGELPTGVFAR